MYPFRLRLPPLFLATALALTTSSAPTPFLAAPPATLTSPAATVDATGNVPVQAARVASLSREAPLSHADFAAMVLSALQIRHGKTEPSSWAKTAGSMSAAVRAAWRLGLVPGGAKGPESPFSAVQQEDLEQIVATLSHAGLNVSGPTSRAGAWVTREAAETLLSALVTARRAHEGDDTASRFATSDGWTFPVKDSWTMRATAYGTTEPGIGNTTASGLHVREGVVAVDPKVIPLGSLLYVEGYGFAVAADTGGAIKGNRIDLYIDGPTSAMSRFGIRKRTVYLIASPR